MDTQTIAKSYHDDGFVIIRAVLSRSEVEALERELTAFIREVAPRLAAGDIYYEDSPARPIKSIFRMHERSEYFHTLMSHPRLMEIMRAVFPGGELVQEGVMFFGKPSRDGSVTPAHQDNAFQCWKQPAPALTATLAIDESTQENGALTVQKGSHKLGLRPHRPSGVLGFSQCLIDPVDIDQFPEVQLCLKPGDLVLHSVNTVHRSGPNTTNHPRRQLGIGYRSSLAERDEQARAAYRMTLEKLHQQAK